MRLTFPPCRSHTVACCAATQAQQWHEHNSSNIGSQALVPAATEGEALASAAAAVAAAAGGVVAEAAAAGQGSGTPSPGDPASNPGNPASIAQQEAADAVFAALWRAQQAAAAAALASGMCSW